VPVEVARPRVPIQVSWSGDRWASPARTRVRGSSVYVTLEPGGEFSTPPETPERERVRGTWACDGAELTMARHGRARNVVETRGAGVLFRETAIKEKREGTRASTSRRAAACGAT